MDFRFSNLLGAPYRGGNLLLNGDELYAPIGNKVGQVWQRSSSPAAIPGLRHYPFTPSIMTCHDCTAPS